jgi:hypothetical protein
MAMSVQQGHTYRYYKRIQLLFLLFQASDDLTLVTASGSLTRGAAMIRYFG